jgi:hypothetical protein
MKTTCDSFFSTSSNVLKNLTLVMDKVSSMIATTLWGVPPGFHPIPSVLNSPQGFLKALNDFDTLDSTKFLLLRVIVNLIVNLIPMSKTFEIILCSSSSYFLFSSSILSTILPSFLRPFGTVFST